jgi:hypothetical protein
VQAQNWIASINNSNLLGFSNWRLPASDNCTGFDCVGSEMGHLFYTEFGLVKDQFNQVSQNNPLVRLFSNIQQSNFYWSGTEAPFTGSKKASVFYFSYGYQGPESQQYYSYAWAVRDGDVAAIPEPETYAMMLAGLGLVGAMARHRKPAKFEWLILCD